MGLAMAAGAPLIRLVCDRTGIEAEGADRGVFLVMMLVGAALIVPALLGLERWVPRAWATRSGWLAELGVVTLVTASAATVDPIEMFKDQYWFGYGVTIATVAALLTPIVGFVYNLRPARWHNTTTILALGVLLLVYLPAVLQTPWSVVDRFHGAYVINELLAPSFDNPPLDVFTSQYSSLLGYLLQLFSPAAPSVDSAVWLLTALAITTLGVALLPFLRLMKSSPHVPVLFTIPGILVARPYTGAYSVLFSSLPLRTFFPALIAGVLYWLANSRRQRSAVVLLGALNAAAIVFNFESGLVAVVASGTVLLTQALVRRRYNLLPCFFIAALLSLGLILLLVRLESRELEVSKLYAFVLGFGSGFGSIAMPNFGLWSFVLLSLATSIAVACIALRRSASDSTADQTGEGVAILTLFWALFGTGMFPYYINRSSVFGQLQFILFPMYFSALGAYILYQQRRAGFGNFYPLTRFALAFPMAMSLASTLHHPSLAESADRLWGERSRYAENFAPTAAALRATRAHVEGENQGGNIGTFADFGSIIASMTGIKSYLSVNAKIDLFALGIQTDETMCRRLAADGVRTLLVERPLQKNALSVMSACGFQFAYRHRTPGLKTIDVYRATE